MYKLLNSKQWKKWNADSINTEKNNTIVKKKNVTDLSRNSYLESERLIIEKISYDKGFKSGKKVGYDLGYKQFNLFKKEINDSKKKIEKIFLNLSKSIESIDSYVSIKIVKVLFSVLKRNNKFFSNNTNRLIQIVKKSLRKELFFLKNLNFLVNPTDFSIIKKSFRNCFKFNNWTLISDNKIASGECKIFSSEMNIDFTNSDTWDNLYRIFLFEKNI
ncbi:FliH/SctL family protein [Buchnera aphidicola (Chaitoregma tattakana)]|uniref:FliH/SctL family protein n=1 Tax=Buchnera aphidicola TaxID=9 RepID=UPI0031B83A7F